MCSQTTKAHNYHVSEQEIMLHFKSWSFVDVYLTTTKLSLYRAPNIYCKAHRGIKLDYKLDKHSFVELASTDVHCRHMNSV